MCLDIQQQQGNFSQREPSVTSRWEHDLEDLRCGLKPVAAGAVPCSNGSTILVALSGWP